MLQSSYLRRALKRSLPRLQRRGGHCCGRHVTCTASRTHRLCAGKASHRCQRVAELNELSLDPDGVLKANAAVALQTLYDDSRVRSRWQALDEALEAVGVVRLRRMITIGGSIGPLVGGFDLPVALLALDTTVHIAGPSGRRHATLPDLFEQRLARDEMVVGVEVAPLPVRSGSSFYKYMARNVLEIPTVNTSAVVGVDDHGNCTHARVVVGSVSWKPIIVEPRELIGQHFNEYCDPRLCAQHPRNGPARR